MKMLSVIFFLKTIDNFEGPTFLYSIANSPYIDVRRQICYNVQPSNHKKKNQGAWLNCKGILLVFPTHLQIDIT